MRECFTSEGGASKDHINCQTFNDVLDIYAA